MEHTRDFNFVVGILLGLCVIACHQTYVDAVFTMNETCQFFAKGYIGDPTDCADWGYCDGGQLKATGTCKEGLLYDVSQGMCNYADQVECRTTIDNACDNIKTPQFIADPGNCNRYCYCSNDNIDCRNCPMGQIFEASSSSCVWPNNYVCPSDSICRLVSNNKFVGDPNKDGNYMRCLNGANGPTNSCSPGYSFNNLKGACDPDYSGGVPELGPNPEFCSDTYTGTGKKYYEDDETCFGYYICTSTSGPGQWGKCPQGTQFDQAKQVCGTPFTVVCYKDRCGNLDLEFVADPGCRSYSVCKNQVSVATGQLCSQINPQFPYFDELSGGCVAVKPKQAICAV